jgi:hypothetical protein
MPTFTGETGARIREMEARLAALESGGGGFDPKKGMFSAYLGAPVSVPGIGAPIIMNYRHHSESNWYNETTGYFKPQLRGFYRLDAYVKITTPIVSGSRLTLMIEGTNQSVLQSVYPSGGDNHVLSGSIIVLQTGNPTNGFNNQWRPYFSHSNPDPVTVDGYSNETISKTYFQGHMVAPYF